jgi:thiopeptide-type bacteriocin biosynthesis protein
MLNNARAPVAMRFLDDMSRDGQAQFGAFDWGPAADFPFLPRVQAGRVVLSLARWCIEAPAHTADLSTESSEAFRAALASWRTRWQVPRHVYLSAGDNRLLLDLEDAAQVEELRSEVRRLHEGGHVTLQEALPAPDQAWATGPGGHFVTELMVPLVLRKGPPADAGSVVPHPRTRAVTTEDRLRPPGSEWLFAKLYCPDAFEDDLIAGPVRKFCEFARAADLAEEWFFIRYADPDPHLRLRFHGASQRLMSELAPELCSWATGLMRDGVCLRFCFDTYEREVERYGGVAGTTAAEALFAADSHAVAELLYLSQQRLLGIDRTTLAILSIDDLLARLGLAEPERLQLYQEYVASRNETGPEYRQRKEALRSLLSDPTCLSVEPGGGAVAEVFAARQRVLASVARRLEALAQRGELGQPRNRLCQSFVHMHCNRLLGSGRSAERMVMGLLLRTREGLKRAPLRGSGGM